MNTMNAQNNIHANQSLNAQQESIVSIAALTAVGDLANLKTQLNTGLDAGLTVNEIKEVLVQLYAYCGFPRSLNAINTFMSVVEERKAKGIKDVEGKDVNVSGNDRVCYLGEDPHQLMDCLASLVPTQKAA